VIGEKFEEMDKRMEIYKGWKNTKGQGKKEKLKEAQKLYKAVIHPKLLRE